MLVFKKYHKAELKLPKSQTLIFCFHHGSLDWRPLFPVVFNLENKPWFLEFRFGKEG